MDLRDALTQIAEIRQQVAQTQTYRGYRAVPVAISGCIAWLAACYQWWEISDPGQQSALYLALWIGAALFSMAITGVFMGMHCLRSSSPLTRSLTLLAVGQFIPCVGAGGLLTFVLFHRSPENLWMLPGLWSLFFGLGIFASYRLLPKATFWVGVYYFVVGTLCLAWAQGEYAFSPWAMGISFGFGQWISAAVLYWTLERTHAE